MNPKTVELSEKLRRNGIAYSIDQKDSSIKIKASYKLFVKTKIEDDVLKITVSPERGNVFSGPFLMSFKNQLFFVTLMYVILGIVTCLYMYKTPVLIPVFAMITFISSVLFLFWGLYSVVVIESIKNIVINLSKDIL